MLTIYIYVLSYPVLSMAVGTQWLYCQETAPDLSS